MDENPYKAPQSDCQARIRRSRKPVKFNKLEFFAHILLLAAAALFAVSFYRSAGLCFAAALICIGLGRPTRSRSVRPTHT
jgi:hypothetical protein